MATVVFADVSGFLYSFRWLELESGFNAFLSVLDLDTGHAALCCTVRQSIAEQCNTHTPIRT